MSSVQNMNSISFRSNYLIPYSEINKTDSETMRQVGKTTAKYVSAPDSMMQTPEGIVVSVSDARDKEYEAIIAKYGLNIQKYKGEIKPQPDLVNKYYNFMVSKIDPQNAEKRINAFRNIKDEKEKSVEYLRVYQEFKNSSHSAEHQQNSQKPKIKPTGTPIIKYATKDGEKMMAREVMFENGYKCIAVSNEMNPNEAILMNKDEFKKSFTESVEHLPKTTSFKGKESKKASGEFADKSFVVECSEGLTNRSMSGSVDDLKFNIKHNGKIFKSDTLTGNIGDKELKLTVKEGFAKNTISGTIGNEPIDLKVSESLSGYRIKGKFKNKDIDIKLNSKLVGYSLESDSMSLRIKNKTLFGNDVKVKGSYNDDPDLIPILMDIVYTLNDEELMVIAASV